MAINQRRSSLDGVGRRAKALGISFSRGRLSAFAFNDIGLDELKAGLADGSILLVDVREADEFAAGHIKGALFNPLSRFDPSRLPVAADGQKVVIYCRSGRRSVSAITLRKKATRSRGGRY